MLSDSKPKIGKAQLIGIITILIFFGGFGLWAYLAPLDSAATAPGHIIVAGYRRSIQHLEGGIVEMIYVKDGVEVQENQDLIKLSDTQAKIKYQVAQNRVYELSAIEARLIAEVGNKTGIKFPEHVIKNKTQPNVLQFMQNQEAIFAANQQSLKTQIEVLQQRIIQLKEQIKGTRAQLTSDKDQLKLLDSELKDVQILADKQLIERSRVFALRRDKEKLMGSIGDNSAKIANLQEKIGETKLEINSVNDKRRKDLLEEVRSTREKLAVAIQEEKSAADFYARTFIKAPIAGKVVDLKVHTVGAVIKPGEIIMDIVPVHEELIVEARINPLDIDVVHTGLTAKVNLTALQLRTTPIIHGVVIYVSPDASIDEATKKSYYKVQVKITQGELKKLGEQNLYPGMPAEVMIVTSRLTPWLYFIDPIERSFRRAFKEK